MASSGSGPSRSSRHESRASARTRAGDGDASRCSIQRWNTRAEDAQRIRLGQFLKHRVDSRLHRPAAQQLRAERVDGADERAIQRPRGVGQTLPHRRIEFPGAALLQFVAHAQLHVPRGGVGERDRHDFLHRRAGGDHVDDAIYQRGGLAGAGRSFHHPAPVEPRREV